LVTPPETVIAEIFGTETSASTPADRSVRRADVADRRGLMQFAIKVAF
jgi:hypothetical protein